jgi:hypothetical protein
MKKVAARAMREDVLRDSDLEIGRFDDLEVDESMLQSRLNPDKSFFLKLVRPLRPAARCRPPRRITVRGLVNESSKITSKTCESNPTHPRMCSTFRDLGISRLQISS